MWAAWGSNPEPQGFSDRDSGWSWAAPITCGFRDCKHSLSLVILGCLDRFCDRRVSKRSSARRDHRSCTLGLVWRPVDLAQPDHTPARGQPSTEPVRAPSSSAPGLACGSPQGGRWDATPCLLSPPAGVLVAGHPGDLPARRGHGLVRPCRVWRCSAAERTSTRALAAGTAVHLQRRLLMLVNVGWCWVMRFVPDLYRGRLALEGRRPPTSRWPTSPSPQRFTEATGASPWASPDARRHHPCPSVGAVQP